MFRTKTRKECRSRLVHLKRSVDYGSYRSVEMLNGLRATKKNHIHKGHGYNQWETKTTKIPTGFVVSTDYDKGWIDEYQCRDANPYPKKGLDMNKWIRKSQVKWLTIADIQKLKPGDRLEVLPLDRNLGDTIASSGIRPNKLYPAPTFFKSNKAIYEHGSGLQGCLTLLSQTEKIVLDPFEFHVEIDKKDNWFPLEKGSLPAKDPQGFIKLMGKKVHWTAMSPKTHVGYRGPMLTFSSLKALPPLFIYKK